MPTTEPKKADHPEACAIVIFGAFGDLTKRLVMPAIYNLATKKQLPEKVALIGVDLADGDAAAWAKHLHDMLESFVGNASSEFDVDKIDEDTWKNLAATMSYVKGDMTKPDLYNDVGAAIDKAGFKGGNVIFYMAIADRFFGTVATELGKAGLTKQDDSHWRRVVVEKPFGHDVESAVQLNKTLLDSLEENQIFRIDHFLGKETVQAIAAFRFANGMFEPLWNRDRIDHVQISAAEVVGVEARGKFYEATGALRDMVPNHLFTLLAMVAMEPPVSFDATGVRNRKAEIFTSMPPLKPEDAVRGQYGAGTVQGKEKAAYRQEPNVSPDSNVETYVALKVGIDSWRWAGVPFYLRTGKHLKNRVTEIAVRFKPAPLQTFAGTNVSQLSANWLVIHIQPEEGFSLHFEVKKPGPEVVLAPVRMDFAYKDFFKQEPSVGYETLLYDVMIGDATLFNRADMVEDAWRVVQPILDAWKEGTPEIYPSGATGPKGAEDLLAESGRKWRSLDDTA
ncbi:glucose-6-phosphate dehydrogenase [Lichenihabitans sp. Uapishka_5]|nr:glucose-6-phosphate dehydrogenase [Lichenihabitans sp. Uapishka_5]